MTNSPNTPAPGTTSPPTTPATPTDVVDTIDAAEAATRLRDVLDLGITATVSTGLLGLVLDELDQARDDRTAYYGRIERARDRLETQLKGATPETARIIRATLLDLCGVR